MSVLFIFIDGVGVGKNLDINPLASSDWSSFSYFTESGGLHDECAEINKNGILYKPIDANLDVSGLPQSGTGQTTLFSGENAAKIAGKHYGPFPYTTTRFLLEEKSLFHNVLDLGLKPTFMNAYPDIFFERAQKRDRWTATTMMARSAGIELNRVEDLLEGKAITAEIIQNVWRENLKLEVPEITKEEAGDRMINAAKTYDLVLYEFYLTDKAGHSMDKKYADQIRDLLDPFLTHITYNMADNDTLVMTSDHGNLEDLSTKTHTRNPVPLFVKGDTGPFKDAKSIMDVTPGIVSVLEREKG
ncbi:hypothetical protein [Rhodohalobacter sp. 8-1]|uniref:hypothetical protein n=1 Tax=Rhodohalobacter sp. 8-1 TaxID=3131972 RepID=UPI0030EB76E2